MDLNAQRKLGVELARSNDAPKTLEIIKNIDNGYAAIFQSAAEELGRDKLAEIILKQGDPEWALAMLDTVSGIGQHHEALSELARPMFTDMVKAPPPTTDAALQQIGDLSLSVKGGASFSASFTMFWSPVPGVTMPAVGYPGQTPPCKWSGTIPVGQQQTMACSVFELPQAKLPLGSTVWMVVWVHGVHNFETSFRFEYTAVAATAKIQADGGLAAPSFSLLGVD